MDPLRRCWIDSERWLSCLAFKSINTTSQKQAHASVSWTCSVPSAPTRGPSENGARDWDIFFVTTPSCFQRTIPTERRPTWESSFNCHLRIFCSQPVPKLSIVYFARCVSIFDQLDVCNQYLIAESIVLWFMWFVTFYTLFMLCFQTAIVLLQLLIYIKIAELVA